MYKKFFGLKEHPFRSTPDEEFFYEGSERGEIIDALLFSLVRGDAIVTVIGEVGVGKTTLVRVLAERLKKSNFELVYIPNPNFSSYDILVFIANELGLKVGKEESKFNIYNAISDKLLEVYTGGKRVAVIIDEAHLIPLETLEEIRLLSNIETNKEKLLSIILVGQPELKNLLSNKEARQLSSRITYEFLVRPLNDQEVYEYLNFRMKKAGYGCGEFFSKKISHIIRRESNGLPRIINNMADQLLLKLYSEGKSVATKADIVSKKRNRYAWFFFFLSLIMLVVIFLGFLLKGNFSSTIVESQFLSNVDKYKNIDVQGNEKEFIRADSGDLAKSPEADLIYEYWSPHHYVIGLLTTPCDDELTMNKVLSAVSNPSVFILKADYHGKVNHWCKVYVGSFGNYRKATSFMKNLPNFVLKNSPFVIEVDKLSKFLSERSANVTFIKP